jgi:hypothetical protein
MSGKHRMYRRWLVVACGVAAAGVFAGAVVGAQFQAPLSVEAASSLREEPLAKVADIPAANGLGGRGVFVQSTSSGFLCLWDAPSANALTRQGGCNRSSDPLGGRKMRISFAYDGGPAIGDVTDARLIGVASLDVATAHVVMTDGTRRDLALKRIPKISGVAGLHRVFGYRLKSSDLERGVGPAAVVALDSAGDEIDRHSTGFEG